MPSVAEVSIGLNLMNQPKSPRRPRQVPAIFQQPINLIPLPPKELRGPTAARLAKLATPRPVRRPRLPPMMTEPKSARTHREINTPKRDHAHMHPLTHRGPVPDRQASLIRDSSSEFSAAGPETPEQRPTSAIPGLTLPTPSPVSPPERQREIANRDMNRKNSEDRKNQFRNANSPFWDKEERPQERRDHRAPKSPVKDATMGRMVKDETETAVAKAALTMAVTNVLKSNSTHGKIEVVPDVPAVAKAAQVEESNSRMGGEPVRFFLRRQFSHLIKLTL